MIPMLLAVAFGAGAYLLFDGLTRPQEDDEMPAETTGRVEEFLLRAGLSDVTPREFSLFSVAGGLAAGVVTQLLLGWPVVSVLIGGLGMMAPLAYYIRRHDRRRAAVQVALVEAMDQLRDAIRSGLSVQEALVNLARTGPEALRPEFTTLARETRLSGMAEALTTMRDRLADPLFDIVAATLILNDRLGGRNVSQVLDRLAHATRAQLRVQEELRAYQAQTVLSAQVVALMPFVVLVIVQQVNPRYLEIFNDVWGQILLALCVVSIIVGYAAMLWITRLPSERRVLR
ncbi:MAG: type II secretion system F family protein [Anaerolineae bacterium]